MSNRDEALRAKDLAEDWMRKSDYATARRVALRAQRLDESLENLTHMIMVCDVHCAALEKSGDEFDWYKILQVEQSADENTIKKQYRKLALHLHPDKNKLPGAESAFKSIGEAQRILLDKDKRRLYDTRRKPLRRPAAPAYQPQQAPTTAYSTRPVFQTNFNGARNSFTANLRPENQQKPQPQPSGQSFWTSCAFCHTKYEYQRQFINKIVTCLSCSKQYVAFQVVYQGPPVQPTFPFSQQNKVPTQEAGKAAEKQPENSAGMSSKKETSGAKRSAATAENSNVKGKRKKMVESSDSSDNRSGCEDLGSTGGLHSRRSVRSKQHVSYKENKSDDDIEILDNKEEADAESAEQSELRKQSRENHLFPETLPNGINRAGKMKKDQAGSSRHSVKDSSSGSASDLEVFECADPDFTNFEKSREERCFKPSQTWAMYDGMDRMPRYYAIIRKVIKKPDFKLKITWLEAEPDDEKAKQWVHKKLPVSVGKFKLGGDETTKETLSFSHVINCRKGSVEDAFSVYPRREEIWALFKNWDMNWSSGRRGSFSEYEYEFVEILSEYAEGVAIEVAFLRKVKGFASVFCRIGSSDTFQVPPHEFLRFSHNIPSTKLTGKEGKGVPAGAYELDTAALPQKMEEGVAVPVSGEASKSTQVHHRRPPSSELDCTVIPNFQFHDFSAERLEGKFAINQIWSLNSKEDGLPKCYAMIQRIVWKPVFEMEINRLEAESLPANVKQWRDKRMPVSCGNFTLKEGRVEALTSVKGFSHQMKPQQRKKDEYIVLPKTGEIWAMYKNWSETIKVASLRKCEYEVVEVLDDNESHIEVMMLERVHGFVSVFKEKVEEGIDVKKTIPRCELLRFSHFVPAFRLTGERDGALRGCVELDPTALSRNLRRS